MKSTICKQLTLLKLVEKVLVEDVSENGTTPPGSHSASKANGWGLKFKDETDDKVGYKPSAIAYLRQLRSAAGASFQDRIVKALVEVEVFHIEKCI